MKISEKLLDCPLFEGIGPDEAAAMLDCLEAKAIVCGKGEAVFLEGNRATRFGVVISGSLVVVKDSLEGKRTIIKHIAQNELVGAAQAFSLDGRMNVRVEADETSRILVMNAQRILAPCCKACSFHAKLIRNAMRILAAKTLELNAKIEILSHRATQDRLLAYLYAFSEKCGSREFDIPFDRQQLADYLCVERSALSAEIGRLASKGRLASRKNHFSLALEG